MPPKAGKRKETPSPHKTPTKRRPVRGKTLAKPAFGDDEGDEAESGDEAAKEKEKHDKEEKEEKEPEDDEDAHKRKQAKLLDTQSQLAELQLIQAKQTANTKTQGKLLDHQKLKSNDCQDYVKVAKYLHRQSKDDAKDRKLAELLRIGAPDLALPDAADTKGWWEISDHALKNINPRYLAEMERLISNPPALATISTTAFLELKHQCTLTVDSFLWLATLSSSGHSYGGRETLLHRMILQTLPHAVQATIGIHLVQDNTVEKLVSTANHAIRTNEGTRQPPPQRPARREDHAFASLQAANDRLQSEMSGLTNSVRDFGQTRNKPDKREMKPASLLK